jgi:hypothetical protein
MRSDEHVRLEARLNDLFAQVAAFQHDPELQAHWAKYLCVLCSGYLETSVRTILKNHVRATAAPHVADFVDGKLDEFQNPKMQKILELCGTFKGQWRESLGMQVEGRLKDAVDSIVANKNNIAHGRDVGLTYVAVREYFQCAKKVIALLVREVAT